MNLLLKTILVSTLLIISTIASLSNEKELIIEFDNGNLYGSLLQASDTKDVCVIIHPGSGPTDRDGNNPYTGGKNNSLRMLADGLALKGISTLRIDKRLIGKSTFTDQTEANLLFTDYVNDLILWVNKIRDEGFKKVVLLGHSEGSLISMIAANQSNADAFISIAGVGRRSDLLIKEQISKQAPYLLEQSASILDSLAKGMKVQVESPSLSAMFRPSIQPYLISWFKFDPAMEIVKLKCPKLIIQGSLDLQVTEQDSELLKSALENAESKNYRYIVLKSMNHVLKEVSSENLAENQISYRDPSFQLAPGLVSGITTFVQGVK